MAWRTDNQRNKVCLVVLETCQHLSFVLKIKSKWVSQALVRMARMMTEKQNWTRTMKEKRNPGSTFQLQDKLMTRLQG